MVVTGGVLFVSVAQISSSLTKRDWRRTISLL
ncbi:hypothetical protein V6Z12_A11G191600 [Gossypium hirsutum]